MKIFSLFCCLSVLVACNKASQQAPIPVISILQAPSSLSVQVPDTVRLTLDLQGEEDLVSLKIDLLNQAQAPVNESKVYALSGKSQRVEMSYPITSANIDDGPYLLTLSLRTARETANRFIPVQLRGIPRMPTGAVFLASDANQTRIFQTDSNGAHPQWRANVPVALKEAVYDPAARCVWLLPAGGNSVYKYQMDGFQASAVFNSLPAPGFDTYTALHLGPQWLYLGRGQGNVVAIDAAGAQKWLYNLPEGHVPGLIRHLQQYFLIELQPIDAAGVRRIQLIEPDRQGLIREFSINGPLLGAALLPNQAVLLLVEEAGSGHLYRFTVPNSRLESETGPDLNDYRSLLPLPNGEIVLTTPQSVLRYSPAAQVRTGQMQVLVNAVVIHLSHDPLLNRLLLLQGGQASYLSLTNGSQQSVTLPEPAIRGFLTRSRK
jgi:hypothetical protein